MPGLTAETRRKHKVTFYSRHREQVKSEVAARKKAVRDWFDQYKLTLCCEHCPENHPACLDFHHLDPNEKETSVTLAVHRGWGIERIKAEIAKCVILCANCHRKEHDRLRKASVVQG
jgi:hypothetical protein